MAVRTWVEGARTGCGTPPNQAVTGAAPGGRNTARNRKAGAGAKVMGTTIAELGNMNRPLDMIAYRKNGSDHILMANSSRGVMKLDANHLEQYHAITDKIAATHGVPYETIGDLQGVRRLDRLGEDQALAMVATGDALNLTTIALP